MQRMPLYDPSCIIPHNKSLFHFNIITETLGHRVSLLLIKYIVVDLLFKYLVLIENIVNVIQLIGPQTLIW